MHCATCKPTETQCEARASAKRKAEEQEAQANIKQQDEKEKGKDKAQENKEGAEGTQAESMQDNTSEVGRLLRQIQERRGRYAQGSRQFLSSCSAGKHRLQS